MARINTNVSSLLAQRSYARNSDTLTVSLERLSTGLRINRGKDDPAGLIASENLRAERSALSAAVGNADRADQVVSIAEGGLQEISNMLTELQGLITETANTAGLSKEEREANQLQIDSILQTIDRVAAATSFQGLKLLSGSFDYTTDAVSASVSSFRVNGAKLPYQGSTDVSVLVTASAQLAGLFLSFGNADLNLGGAGAGDGAGRQFVFEIAGNRGSRELSFSSGSNLTNIVAAINTFSQVTGVRARVSGTTGIRLESLDFGSDQLVSVRVNDDGSILDPGAVGVYKLQAGDSSASQATRTSTYAAARNKVTDFGQDVQGTINGIIATTRGTVARITTDFLDVEVNLVYDAASSNPNAAKLGRINAFSILGGGADFQLAGNVDIAGKVSVGIQDFAVRNVGRTNVDVNGTDTTFFLKDLVAGRSLNVVDGNPTAAQEVVSAAIKEVTSLRGRLGAFQKNTIGATVRSLGIALENTTAAESVIRDTDFAEETSALTRAQILVSSSVSTLGLANSSPQAALQLLG
ncbi:MAG TPA: flagellin [Phycisphaerales bacterium]|nr:flagellin [Phycisphaerales bacterium]